MQDFLVGPSPGLYRTYQGDLSAYWKSLNTREETGKQLVRRLTLGNHDAVAMS